MKNMASFLVLFAGLCAAFAVAAKYGQNQGGGGRYHQCQHTSECPECHDGQVRHCFNYHCSCTGCWRASDCRCSQGHTPTCSYGSCHCIEHSQSSSQSSQFSLSGHCYHTSDCPHCSDHLVRHCFNYRCTCTELPLSPTKYCSHSSDCSSCSNHHVGFCSDYKCTCTGNIHCSEGFCNYFGCPGGSHAECAVVNGHHRCMCKPSPSPSSSNHCVHNSDCTKCSEYQVGQCSNNQCTCSASIACSDNGCHGYGCGSGWYPKCGNLDGHSRCLCEPLSSPTSHNCGHNSDCTNCSEYQVGQCHNNQCTCSAKISCSHDNGCHGYGCGRGWYPKCGNLDGQSRCLCEPSSSSTKHQCDQSSDCTNCSEYQIGQCHNHQCTCSAKISCSHDNGCHGYGCGSGWYPKCGNLDGQSRCLCEPSTSSSSHQCVQSSDCTNCSEYQVGQCHNHRCTCSAKIPCTHNDVCHSYGCGSGFHPKCATLDGQPRCLCKHIPVTVSTTAYPTVSPSSSSSSHQCEHSSDCTSCSEYQVGQCHSHQCTCSVNNSCSHDNECQLYGCKSGLHPKCGTIDGDDRCICGHTHAAVATTHTNCQDDSDCATLPCSNDKPVPYCNHFPWFFTDIKRCHCKEDITSATTTTKQTTTKSSTSAPASTTASTIISTSTESTTSETTVPKTTSPPTTTSTSTTMPSTTTATTTDIPSREGKSTTSFTTTEPTTETLKTTTTDPPTTPLVTTPATAIRKCHTCGNANNSLTCDTRTIYLGNLQQCAPGKDFCMTDIVHDGGAIPKTYKRCVTEKECRNKWLHQTSDLEYCINYGSVPMSGQYSCHFCCVSDGCNAGQVPDKSTYYSKA